MNPNVHHRFPLDRQYECTNAPLEFNGEAQSWWNDRNGRPRYFWSGNYSETHLCQCGIDGSCVDPDLRCNCDAVSGQKEVDSGPYDRKKNGSTDQDGGK